MYDAVSANRNEDYYSKRLFTPRVMAFARDRGAINKSISLVLKALDTNNRILMFFFFFFIYAL